MYSKSDIRPYSQADLTASHLKPLTASYTTSIAKLPNTEDFLLHKKKSLT